jgi:topoisomerase-4 subunit A
MLDVNDQVGIVAAFAHRPGARRVIASKMGYGFILIEDDAVAMRKAGKQVLNVGSSAAAVCLPADGDHLAVVGDNGRILVFPMNDLPLMARGKGVKLQRYRQGGLRDAAVFAAAEGASWMDAASRARAWPDWRAWLGSRAAAGRAAPKGFPASRRFRPG